MGKLANLQNSNGKRRRLGRSKMLQTAIFKFKIGQDFRSNSIKIASMPIKGSKVPLLEIQDGSSRHLKILKSVYFLKVCQQMPNSSRNAKMRSHKSRQYLRSRDNRGSRGRRTPSWVGLGLEFECFPIVSSDRRFWAYYFIVLST